MAGSPLEGPAGRPVGRGSSLRSGRDDDRRASTRPMSSSRPERSAEPGPTERRTRPPQPALAAAVLLDVAERLAAPAAAAEVEFLDVPGVGQSGAGELRDEGRARRGLARAGVEP